MKNLLVISLMGVIGGSVFGQVQPDAGALANRPQPLQPDANIRRDAGVEATPSVQVQQSAATPQTAQDGESDSQDRGAITVHGFRFESDTQTVTESELQAQMADLIGKKRSFRQLQQAVTKLEAWLQAKKGLIAAKAWMPIQEINNGVVTVKILQGTLTSVQMDKNAQSAGRKSDTLLEIAKQQLKEGSPLLQSELEAAAYRTMDYAGRPVSVILAPASQLGSYDVLLSPQQRNKISGSISVDNTGNPYINEWHETTYLLVDDLTGHSDQLSFTAQLLTPNQKIFKTRYQIPTANGWLFGAGAQYTNYKLAGEFAPLRAKGDTRSVAVDAAYNVYRNRAFSLMVGGSLQHREIRNEQLGANISDRRLDSATLNASAFWSGAADHSLFGSLTFGSLNLSRNPADLAFDGGTARANGNFTKISMSYSQFRPITAAGAVRFNLNGQWANKGLDSSEKLSLGGLTGVRAYPYGEGFGDVGVTAQLEYSHRFNENWQASAFYDYGMIWRNKNAWVGAPTPNRYHLQGAGLSLTWHPFKSFSLQGIVASKIGNNPTANVKTGADSDGKSSRVRTWLMGAWSF